MVPLPGHWDDGGINGLDEEPFAAEAGVPLPSIRIEDSERRLPAGWAGPVAGDDHLRSLADDVPPEADPRSPSQLETDPGRLTDGSRHIRDEARRLQDHETDPGPPGERREPAESVGNTRRGLDARREIQDEEIHGPAREQRARDRETLVRVAGREDHEPLRPDAASDSLDGIEGRREVHPGHDRAGCLGLRDESQGERRPAAREVAPEREAHPAWQAAGPEDRVESREAGREETSDRGPAELTSVLGERVVIPAGGCRDLRQRQSERSHDLSDPARRGRSPLRPEGRQGRRDIRRE